MFTRLLIGKHHWSLLDYRLQLHLFQQEAVGPQCILDDVDGLEVGGVFRDVDQPHALTLTLHPLPGVDPVLKDHLVGLAVLFRREGLAVRLSQSDVGGGVDAAAFGVASSRSRRRRRGFQEPDRFLAWFSFVRQDDSEGSVHFVSVIRHRPRLRVRPEPGIAVLVHVSDPQSDAVPTTGADVALVAPQKCPVSILKVKTKVKGQSDVLQTFLLMTS